MESRWGRGRGLLEICAHNLRDYAPGPHHITDDRPFGGGEGMVMKLEPIVACLETLVGEPEAALRTDAGVRVVLLSAQGKVFRQSDARRFAGLERLVLICGRYEGVDERIALHCADEELSVGDFVLSGGEPAAALVVDATARLLAGVVGHEDSTVNESFTAEGAPGGLLDCPHFTRPVEFRGWSVPEVLRGGDHEAIRRWRRREALRKTLARRPELLAGAPLSADDRELLGGLGDSATLKVRESIPRPE